MKKLLFALMLSMPLLLNAQTFDVRKVKWGMTKAEVKKSEQLPMLLDDPTSLTYDGFVAGLKAKVYYIFSDGGLVIMAYSFNEKYMTKNQYILDFETLKASLIEKYGEPLKDDVVWVDDLYKDDKRNYGLAVSTGALKYNCVWRTERSQIYLSLKGKDYKVDMSCGYSSLEYLKKPKEKGSSSDL